MNKRMTVKRLFDDIIGSHQLIPLNLDTVLFPWISNYYIHHEKIDNYFKKQYGDYYLFQDPVNYAEWSADVLSTLFINADNLKHLWKLTQVEYSPIENVVEHRETDIVTDERTDTDRFGSHTDTTHYGGRVDQENVGTDGKTGNSQTQTADGVVPYDMSLDKNVATSSGQVTNTELETKTTKGPETDDVSYGSREDTKITGEGHTLEVMDRHANVGVTSNVDLMRQELDFWGNEFAFYIQLFKLIKRDWLNGCL